MSAYRWRANGTEDPGRGTILRPLEDEGVIEAESIEEAFRILVTRSASVDAYFWDSVWEEGELSITIAAEQEGT